MVAREGSGRIWLISGPRGGCRRVSGGGREGSALVAVLEAEFEAAVLGGEGPGVADGFEKGASYGLLAILFRLDSYFISLR